MTPLICKDEKGKNAINWPVVVNGVLVSLILASITSAVTLLWTVPVIEKEIQALTLNITEIKVVDEKHENRLRDVEISMAAHEARVSH